MVLTSLILLVATFQEKNMSIYRDDKLGLQFEHPKSWKLRRDKYSGVFEIVLQDGQKATLQIFNAKYKGTADDFQAVQLQINTAMKRNVERQWEEDYLGVPMLMSKISYNESGVDKVGIIGLLYTSFEQKLNFRLTSPAKGADEAENLWRSCMITLRTTNGELPAVEDPSKPSIRPEKAKPTAVWESSSGLKKPIRGQNILELESANTKFKLSLGNGWTIKGDELKSTSLKGKLQVRATLGLAEEAGQSLVSEAKIGLTEFTSVSQREDLPTTISDSGAIQGNIVRIGKNATGNLVLAHYVGYCEGIYWNLTYRANGFSDYQNDKKLLTDLCRLLYAERS